MPPSHAVVPLSTRPNIVITKFGQVSRSRSCLHGRPVSKIKASEWVVVLPNNRWRYLQSIFIPKQGSRDVPGGQFRLKVRRRNSLFVLSRGYCRSNPHKNPSVDGVFPSFDLGSAADGNGCEDDELALWQIHTEPGLLAGAEFPAVTRFGAENAATPIHP